MNVTELIQETLVNAVVRQPERVSVGIRSPGCFARRDDIEQEHHHREHRPSGGGLA